MNIKNNIARFLKKFFYYEKSLILPSGNEFYYTRHGFGINKTKEHRTQALYNFAVKEQIMKKPMLIHKFKKFIQNNPDFYKQITRGLTMNKQIKINKDADGEQYLDLNDFADLYNIDDISYYELSTLENGQLSLTFYNKNKELILPNKI